MGNGPMASYTMPAHDQSGDDSAIVPFGKYNGQPIEVLLADQNYLQWVISQPGLMAMLQNRYPAARTRSGTLVLGSFEAVGATLAQVRAIFGERRIVTVAEVQAIKERGVWPGQPSSAASVAE